jgi:5-methylcytosine-specific restriction endonuclease McrA
MSNKYRALEAKADRLLQQHYVPINPNCIVCGGMTSEMHHVVYKSQSNALRYDPLNLVPLCKKCHCRHHLSGDPNILATIIKVKGQAWFDDLQSRRHTITKLNREYLLNVIRNLDQV